MNKLLYIIVQLSLSLAFLVSVNSSVSSQSNSLKIVFSSEQEGHFELYTISPSGSDLTRLTASSEYEDWRPNWSPDGSQIAFNSSRDGNPEIYVMNEDGSNIQRLTNHAASDYMECWLINTQIPPTTAENSSRMELLPDEDSE